MELCGRNGSLCGTITRTISMFLIVAGFLMSIVSLMSCEFISYNAVSETVELPILPAPFYSSRNAKVGFTRYDVPLTGEGCGLYSADFLNESTYVQPFHNYFFGAWSSVGISLTFIIISGIFFFIECCCCRFCSSRFWMGGCLIIATTFQGVSFVLKRAENLCDNGRECTLGPGGKMSIAATVLYFVAAVAIMFSDKPETLAEACCRKKGKKEDEEEPYVAGTEDQQPQVEKEAAVAAEVAKEAEVDEEQPEEQPAVAETEKAAGEEAAAVETSTDQVEETGDEVAAVETSADQVEEIGEEEAAVETSVDQEITEESTEVSFEAGVQDEELALKEPTPVVTN